MRWDLVVPVEMEGHPGLTLPVKRDKSPSDVADPCGPHPSVWPYVAEKVSYKPLKV
jgi:hypothetical protein